MRIRGVIFDLDDTLYPEMSFVIGGFRAVADFLSKIVQMDAKSIVDECCEIQKRLSRARPQVFDEFLLSHGCYSKSLVDKLVTIYRDHDPDIALYPDVLGAFRLIAERGIKTGLITDGLAKVQRKKVAALGILNYFDTVIFTDELGGDARKPSPVPFVEAAKRLNLDPGECVYIGNDPTKDFEGPKRIGMASVHILRNNASCRGGCLATWHGDELTAVIQGLPNCETIERAARERSAHTKEL